MRSIVQAPEDRDVRVNVPGATIHLKAGQKRRLPKHLALAAGAKGCYVLPDDGTPDEDLNKAPAPAGEAGDPESDEDGIDVDLGGEYEETARHDAIKAAVRAVIERGDPKDFTAAKAPRKNVVRSELSFDVSGDEIDAAIHEAVNDNST